MFLSLHKESLHTSAITSALAPHPQPQAATDPLCLCGSVPLPVLTPDSAYPWNRTICDPWYYYFCHSVMLPKSVYVVACISVLSSFLWPTHHVLYGGSSADRHLDNAARDIRVHIFVWTRFCFPWVHT
ncbi:hypothetical protein HJG60_011034 [Phyllostomus discolor]|uniref:Uncharacterized protein n=1 Tax=Phyllostomus discolor TaxID=89673 RepID=A0A834AF38_9CHIR|nr:hypothetical protein HJG60_011034 [Phyllostomus discolor]